VTINTKHRTILLYPLTPFFIIFCNVIATSNREDYNLLTQITVALSRIKEYNPSILRLHGLFSQFTVLCDQLYEVQAQDSLRQPEPTKRDVSGQGIAEPVSGGGGRIQMYPQVQELHNSDNTGNASMSQETALPDMAAFGSNDEGLYERASSVWDDGLMWELFTLQPTIEWFDMGHKDSATGS
jgi:hypothetical protein